LTGAEGRGLSLRFCAWPRRTPDDPPGPLASGLGEPVPDEAVGEGPTWTGPVEAGGMNGTSIAPVRPSSSSSWEPAVMAAKVGSEASPTSRATINT
jgi:hypothetical protein